MSQSNDTNSGLETPAADSEDFIMVDEDLPFRPKPTPQTDAIQLQLHSIPSESAFLIACQPLTQPVQSLEHAPCDIVLVIDVSGSMNCAAPLPDTGDKASKEDTGLSILDLVKHSSRTILELLNEHDRLGIVTFSDDAKVIQELTPITPAAKVECQKRIEHLHDNGITNLWSGIKAGLQLFENVTFTNNIQGIYVLTDGMPNHMCPKQGYVNKLKPMLANMAEKRAKAGATMPTMHTFGFGYSIRSDLMQSIAEIGNGNYAFIPDAGMIGTVFVHAVANLFSTVAVNAVLEVEPSRHIDVSCTTVFNVDKARPGKVITFQLGNLQYGQSRDLILQHDHTSRGKIPGGKANIKITLRYYDRFGKEYSTSVSTFRNERSSPTPEFVAYHLFRSQLCAHLASFFPIGDNGEHKALSVSIKPDDKFTALRSSVQSFIDTITSHPYSSDPDVASLIQDLTAADGESHGQVSKALLGASPDENMYYQKWGKHYLPSLLHAHARQICNSFKDPGPLRYGMSSPLFVKKREELDAAFENLPAPKPSRFPLLRTASGHAIHVPTTNMSSYHRSSNPCFTGSCFVSLEDGNNSKPVSNLRAGDRVWTPRGPRTVAKVTRTDPPLGPTKSGQLCQIGDLWVTPWHPVLIDGIWTFPASVAAAVREFDEPVFNILLAPSQDPEAHAISVGGVVCVTLGHGITTTTTDSKYEDVRMHDFFGNYEQVEEGLYNLPRDDNGHYLCGGIERDSCTGLVCRFLPGGGSGGKHLLLRSRL